MTVNGITVFSDSVAQQCVLFHTPGADPTAYIRFRHRDGRLDLVRIRSRAGELLLRRLHFEWCQQLLGRTALRTLQDMLETLALFDGPSHPVFTRVAALGERVYLDLANAHGEALEIDSTGWRVTADPPVMFVQAPGMLPLPHPRRGGSLNRLKFFLKIGSAPAASLAENPRWVGIMAFLVGAIRGLGPHLGLLLLGPEGSAKSTMAKVLRMLIDPNEALLRQPPRSERDLVVSAAKSHMVAFDNVSQLNRTLADALCRVATGAGFAKRRLFTDDEEFLLSLSRPVLLTAIADPIAPFEDLVDRFWTLDLPPFTGQRYTEARFWAVFQRAHPALLAGLADTLSGVLATMHQLPKTDLPRMADNAQLLFALERVVKWPEGTVRRAVGDNQREQALSGTEGSPVTMAIIDLMKNNRVWRGTAGELLLELPNHYAWGKAEQTPGWPKLPADLGMKLRRAMPLLAEAGIALTMTRTNRQRTLTLTRENAVSDSGTTGDGPCADAAAPVTSETPENPPALRIVTA